MQCKTCQNELSEAEFGQYGMRGKLLRRKSCRKCRRDAQNKRYAENPEVREKMITTARLHELRKKYGLSPDEYRRMLDKSDGKCIICLHEVGEKKLNVDHCHTTGKVRGLIC